jgi:hypothetical protein
MLPSHRSLFIAALAVLGFAAAAPAAPVYQITTLGLTGPTFTVPNGTGGIPFADPVSLISNGQVVGTSYEYNNLEDLTGTDPWIYTGGHTVELGFYGGVYQANNPGSGGGILHQSTSTTFTINGQIAGNSFRYNSAGQNIGQDAWVYYPTTNSTTQIGFTGGIYQSTDLSGNIHRSSSVSFINLLGEVVGTSTIINSSQLSVGTDAWLYNPANNSTTQLGFIGGVYQNVVAGTGFTSGIHRTTTPEAFNNIGQAVGISSRYNSTGAITGNDAWFYNPIGGTNTQVGFTGGIYAGTYTGAGGGVAQQSAFTHLNSNGYATGNSSIINGSDVTTGKDTWLYNANNNTTTQIGFTGGIYQATYTGTGGGLQRNSAVQQLSTTNYVTGASQRYNSADSNLGQDAWLYNANTSTTSQIGLTGGIYEGAYSGTGGGVIRSSTPTLLNTAGQVAGTSNIYNSAGTQTGQDTWEYSSGITKQIGLTGGVYQSTYTGAGGGTLRNSALSTGPGAGLNADGDILGTSQRYNSAGTNIGQDSWFYNGTTTQQMGLTGGIYETPNTGTGGGTIRSSTPTALNDNHDAIGYSMRYNNTGGSLGQDGWFFNSATDTTTLINTGNTLSNGSVFTDPVVITDTGVVLGEYDPTGGGTDLFWWQNGSFYNLGSLVSGGLSAQDWQNLEQFYNLSPTPISGNTPQYIVGSGLLTGSGGAGAFLLTALPEPTMLAPIAFGALLLKRPRRKLPSI